MEKLESERKFLVDSPKSWFDLSEIVDNLVDIKRITQTYLTPIKEGQVIRVRKTIEGLAGKTKTVYHFTQKELVSPGVNKEKEKKISKEKYENLLGKSNKDKVPIEKTRFVFRYYDQVFELDVFKGHLKGAAILEIELNDIEDQVKLPSFLTYLKEVTDDIRYANYNLADHYAFYSL